MAGITADSMTTTRYWQGFERALQLFEEALRGDVHVAHDLPFHLRERYRQAEEAAVAYRKDSLELKRDEELG